jgi:hypothetical protein
MRNSTFAVVLILLAVIAWFGLQGSPPRAAAVANPATQNFEYRRVTWGFENDSTLNALGAQGWEMCGVIPHEKDSETVVMFKRPKQ